jgi:hypothetical protein
MIELTPEQRQSLAAGEPESLYNDSPWTDEEMHMLAEEAGELLDRWEA